MNSSNRNGRLSIADGSRKPCSTSVSLRERSPSNWPCSCGIATCDSSSDAQPVVGEVVEQRVGRLVPLRGRRGASSSSRRPRSSRPRAASRGRRWCACAAAALRAACPAPSSSASRSTSSASMPSIACFEPLLVGDVVRRREQRERVELLDDLAGERVDRADALDLVAEQLRCAPPAPRTRGTPRSCRRARGTCCGRTPKSLRSYCSSTSRRRIARWSRSSPTLEHQQLLGVHLGRTEAVDRRDRRDDDHVAAGEQRARGRVAQPVDLVVDRAVLLDVRVGRREVRLGLVVVVVGDEVLDPVLREQLAELGRELRGEGLVRRQHQRRPVAPSRSRWRS